MIANEIFLSFSDYMKYEGIKVNAADVAKLVDIYERIVIALTVGSIDNSLGLNIFFTGEQNIDFGSMDESGIETIKNFIIELNSRDARFPIFESTLNSILAGNNIVTVFKHIHHMLSIILAFGKEYIKAAGNNSGVMYTFTSKSDDDGSHLSIFGFGTVDGNILFRLESDVFVDLIPNEITRV